MNIKQIKMRPFVKISSKVHNAIMLITFIKERKGKETIPLSFVSDHLKLSYGYLEQVAKELKKAGILESYRGSAGGYKLARNNISVFEVIEAIEGPINLVQCAWSPFKCGLSQKCPAKGIWPELQNEILKSLKKVKIV